MEAARAEALGQRAREVLEEEEKDHHCHWCLKGARMVSLDLRRAIGCFKWVQRGWGGNQMGFLASSLAAV